MEYTVLSSDPCRSSSLRWTVLYIVLYFLECFPVRVHLLETMERIYLQINLKRKLWFCYISYGSNMITMDLFYIPFSLIVLSSAFIINCYGDTTGKFNSNHTPNLISINNLTSSLNSTKNLTSNLNSINNLMSNLS